LVGGAARRRPAAVELTAVCRIPAAGASVQADRIACKVRGNCRKFSGNSTFGDVKVLPGIRRVQKDAQAELLQLDKVSRVRQQGAGTEFVTLDEYRRGDDPRRIDWRSTARHGYPIVRRYQVERHRDVMILVDSGRLMGALTDRGSKLDCAVDSALNLARVVLDSGDRCGIGFFDSALQGFLPPVAGPKSLRHLVECVYDLQTQWQNRFSGLCRDAASSVETLPAGDFVDLGDAERPHALSRWRLNRRHLVLFAALRTPSSIRDPPHDDDHSGRSETGRGDGPVPRRGRTPFASSRQSPGARRRTAAVTVR
jgi:uncharacterized protein (DUF58 family)